MYLYILDSDLFKYHIFKNYNLFIYEKLLHILINCLDN